MRKSLQIILFGKAFLLGAVAPVFILLLTAHGATVETVSLFVGVASLFTLLAEFPSGVFADLLGRKRSFLLSLLLHLAAYAMLLLFRSAVSLAGAMALYGLSVAFMSGSIEALAIDEAGAREALVKVTGRLNVLESAGLALGALCSGALAAVGADYTGNIVFSIGGYLVLLLLTQLTVTESAHIGQDRTHPPRLREHLQKSFSFAFGSRTVRMIFILSALTAIAMAAVETFWQPAFRAFSASTLLYGVVGFIGFGGVVVGSKVSEWLLTRLPQSGVAVFLLSKALMGVCLAFFMAAMAQASFILAYSLWYVFLGGNGVAEQTLLNREAPARQRASVLSLQSFVFRLGSLAASLYCYFISSSMDYRYAWLFSGILLGTATLAFAIRGLVRGVAARRSEVRVKNTA